MKLAEALLKDELKIFEKEFREAVKSQVLCSTGSCVLLLTAKENSLRPMFVLLYPPVYVVPDERIDLPSRLSVELLHTATLVHDDVVDESLERRGFFSTYALWKTKISVLVGDYLLAKGSTAFLIITIFEFFNCFTGRKVNE